MAENFCKYYKLVRQVSYNNGQTWSNVDPPEYQRGDLYESESTDCPNTDTIYRWNTIGEMCDECWLTKVIINDSSGNTYTVSGSGEIISSEVSDYARVATDVVITNYCTSIGDNAFSGFSSVSFVRIPSTVQTIGANAFNGCVAMTECQIPYGTTSIGRYAFVNCTSLAYADIPSTVISIGESAFRNCLNFRYISIPSAVTVIPQNCFRNCDGLSDIELHSSITSIENSAFEDCTGLFSVTVLATVPPTLGNDVFKNTNSDLKIYVPSASLNVYKSSWSSYSNKIYPIS